MKAYTERGTAILEMVFFTPLMLLFLFLVIDGGLTLLEKAAITDALRAGIHTEALFSREASLLQVSENLSLEVSPDPESLLGQVASEVAENMASIQGYKAEEIPDSFRVTLAAVLLEIDPQTGKVKSHRTIGTISLPDHAGSFRLQEYNPEYPYRTMEDFVARELEERDDEFGLASGPIYDPILGGTQGELRYLDRAVALYGEVTARPRGINARYVKSVLGNFYALQDQVLVPLRTQLS